MHCSLHWYRGEVKLNKIEETENKKDGSRFLLELVSRKTRGRCSCVCVCLLQDIELEGESEVVHTSEYVYLGSGSSSTLCHTSNFQWRRNVDVYLVVSLKNLGLWIQHLIHNMEHVRDMYILPLVMRESCVCTVVQSDWGREV